MTAWTLHRGDCLEGLRGLADKSVDVCLTDPPYDEHTHSAVRGAGRVGRFTTPKGRENTTAALSRKRDLGFVALTAEQMDGVAGSLSRVVKRWSLVFCSLEMISDWRAAGIRHGLEYVRTCLWHKLGSTPQFTGDRPAVAAEAIVVFHPPGRKRWNGGGKHGYYAFPIVLDRGNGIETRCHTTQKPLPLATAILEDFSNPGELVLDCFTGSGTFGVAANHLGRRFIGWELDAAYYEIARRRLSGDEAKPRPEQPSLFGAGAP